MPDNGQARKIFNPVPKTQNVKDKKRIDERIKTKQRENKSHFVVEITGCSKRIIENCTVQYDTSHTS